jgi:hypothetical protein
MVERLFAEARQEHRQGSFEHAVHLDAQVAAVQPSHAGALLDWLEEARARSSRPIQADRSSRPRHYQVAARFLSLLLQLALDVSEIPEQADSLRLRGA